MQRSFWWTAFFLFSLGCVAVWGFATYRDHAATLEDARDRLEATTLLLEQHASRAFEAGHTLLQSVAAFVETADLADPAVAETLHSQMNVLKGNSPQISSAWVMGRDGVAVAETWVHPPAATGSFAQREYFQAHLAGEKGLYFGPLATGGTSGRARFTLSRGVFAEDGTLRAVVVAGIFSEYFSSLYAQAQPGAGARMSLTRLDGTPLAVWPADPAAETGGASLVSEAMLDDYPVHIRVSRTVDAVLAPWRWRSALTGAAALAAISAFGWLTSLGLRAAAREERLRDDMLSANERLEEHVEARTRDLQIAHVRLRSLLEAAGAGTFVWQLPDGDVISDTGLAALFGHAPDEALAKPVESFLRHIHPEDQPRVRARIAELLAGGMRYDDEYRVILPDGAERWVIARGSVDADRLFTGAAFDVTDLKLAQQAAAENEKRLRLVADAVPALVSRVGRDLRYRFVNRAYEEWFGVRRGDVIGQRVADVLGKGAMRDLGPRMQEALEGRTVRFDIEAPYESGGVRHVDIQYIPDRAPDGSVKGFFAFVVDITQRKKDEAALLEVSSRMEALAAERTAILGQLAEGVIVTDDRGRVIFVNEAAARIHGMNTVGVTPEAFASTYNLFTLDGAHYPSGKLPLSRAVLARETVLDERWLIRRPDGSEVVAIGSARPVYTAEGRFLGGVLTMRDDTARHAAEEALAVSERRLNAVLDNTQMAVFMMDDAQRCVYMNTAAEALTGYSFAETEGRVLHDMIHHTHPDGRHFPMEECPIDRAFPENHQMQGEEVFVDRAGRFYPVAYTASPIRDSSARVVGTVIEVRDIRAEKEDAERLRMLIGELNHRVKNTLATVQSIVAAALRGSDVPAGVRDRIEARLSALSRSHDLLTRQQWGQADLRQVVGEALQPFGAADERAARFVVSGGPAPLRPKAALTLSMALHELATNAVKYGALSGPEGRVVLSWRTEEGRLRLVWQEEGGPPVLPPGRKGFGTRLIERGLAHELDGTVTLDFAPSGLRCEIDLPLGKVEHGRSA
jgi:PAS domain S-box-containing protein